MVRGKSVKLLTDWFERQKRVLPWRDQPTLYRVWISEMMLQQTQVATVIPYFERWMERFPSLDVLAAAEESDVLTYWSGLGYYSRARNILRAAKIMHEAGAMPVTKDAWLEIPGVGPYTAGAIVSIALGQPEAILDGNVERVLSRRYCIGREKGDTEFKSQLWARAHEWVIEAHMRGISPSALNQGMMELGAMICSPRKPKCMLCPIRVECEAFAAQTMEQYPPKRARPKAVVVQEQVDCFIRGHGPSEKIFLRQRTKGEWCVGLWDFPVAAKAQSWLTRVPSIRYVVTNHKIERNLIVQREKTPPPGSKGLWVSPSQVRQLPVGSALVKSLKKLGLVSESMV